MGTNELIYTWTVAEGKMWASADNFPSLKKFDTSNFVDDLRPTVEVPLTDNLSGKPKENVDLNTES